MTGNSITKARLMKSEILAAMDGNDRITARDKIIIRRVLDGETYKSVGADFGISRERVRSLCFINFARKLGFRV